MTTSKDPLHACLERALHAAQAEDINEIARALIEAVGHYARAEQLHSTMVALRDEAAQAVAMVDRFNLENEQEHTHNPATPLDPDDTGDAEIIEALRAGHGERWGLRLVDMPDVLALEPDETTAAGQELFNHARYIGQIARGEIDPDEGGPLQ